MWNSSPEVIFSTLTNTSITLELPIDSLKLNFDESSLWMLNLALAFVMFGIALELRVSDFKTVLQRPKSVLLGVIAQFLVLPALTYLLILLLEPHPSFALGMLLVACCPGGNVSNFMTHWAGGNSALSVCLTAIATLGAVIITPVNFHFWGSLYPPTETLLQAIQIDFWAMARLVGMLLGIPVLLGMALGHWYPVLAGRMARYFKIGSLLFFALLVVLALARDFDVFLDYVGLVFLLVLAHNLIALASGYSLARLFRLSQPDIKTLTIETGIQNSGLGLLLIFTFFGGLGGMALIAAFWGIWHLISGMAIAGFWSSPVELKPHKP